MRRLSDLKNNMEHNLLVSRIVWFHVQRCSHMFKICFVFQTSHNMDT